VMVPLIFIFLKEKPASAGVSPFGAQDDWTEPLQIKQNAGKLAIDTLKKAIKVRDFLVLDRIILCLRSFDIWLGWNTLHSSCP